MPATARVCIGNRFAVIEAVLILATTVQRFRLERVEDRPCAARADGAPSQSGRSGDAGPSPLIHSP